ncbi:hypothetical protein DFO70_11823 [Cytobacillus firmus]|uniref:Uncharacterized protein n=2 Tax=Cytobacillus TaxID=2675230 RepID=A0A366JLB2_CYTFI|nr:hypothetical protein DFO70_11823 [Cytobacillus firmus]TDX39427.1 hypothetical protein DFO72_11023 [Cytobacillus oceanisediminis]
MTIQQPFTTFANETFKDDKEGMKIAKPPTLVHSLKLRNLLLLF